MGIDMTRLTYYMHDGPRTFRFELAGNLAGSAVAKLAQAWHTASSTTAGKTFAVDLTFVGGVDRDGHRLLEHWRQAGACFVANSPPSRTLVESITGQPYASPDRAVGLTAHPRFASVMLRTVLFTLVAAVTLLFPARASAADLKQETLDAWDRYLQQANARMLERAKGTFLWAAESPDRLNRVRAGEVVVSPMSHAPEAVPSGLIHHWIGAAFIAGARIDDLIAVVRDYGRYPQFYKPSVMKSKTLSRKAQEDRFAAVVMADKAMFMRRVLDSEYQSRFTEVDSRKRYNVSQTIHVRELAGDGRPGVPVSESSGYIWRLCTMSRYEERDGGVYIETEAMALSRPIPATLHWVVDPMVRRVSRGRRSPCRWNRRAMPPHRLSSPLPRSLPPDPRGQGTS
jgi:hypothetical protein